MDDMFPDEIKPDNTTVIVDVSDTNHPSDVFIVYNNSHLEIKGDLRGLYHFA